MLLGEKKIKTNTEKDWGFYLLYVSSMLLCVLLRGIPLFWVNWFDSEIGNVSVRREKLSLQCWVILLHC